MRTAALFLLLVLAGCAGPVTSPEATTEAPQADGLPAAPSSEGGLANGTAPSHADGDPAQNQSIPATPGNQSAGPDDASGANDTTDAPGGQDGNGTDPDGNQSDPDGSPGDPDGSQGDPDSNQTLAPDQRLLEVSVFDYTNGVFARPQGTEIVVAGEHTWKPDLSYGSAGPQPMGHHVVDELQQAGLVVFPDGRDGLRCAVDFRVTPEMEDESHDAVTHVEIYDAEVWIYGMAIPGHPGWDSPFVCGR